jgi:hypothetical protein
MRPKAIWFTTLSISTLALVAAVSLSRTAANLWNPEVAQAAKVTAHLVKSKSLNPIALARRNRAASSLVQPNLPQANSEQLIRYAAAQPLSLDYPPLSAKATAPASLAVRPAQIVTSNRLLAAPEYDLVDRHNELEKSLRERKYQIKKLELKLATEQLKDGTISQAAFDQKAAEYKTALQEFKQFFNSSKITD